MTSILHFINHKLNCNIKSNFKNIILIISFWINFNISEFPWCDEMDQNFRRKKRFDFNSTILNRKKGENLNKSRYNHSLNVLHDQLHNTHQSLKLHVFESWCNKTRQRIQRLTLTSDQVSYIARQAFSCFNMNKVKHLKNKKKRNCQISKFVSLSKQIFKKNFFLSSWGKSLAPQTKLFSLEKTKVEWKNGTNIFH